MAQARPVLDAYGPGDLMPMYGGFTWGPWTLRKPLHILEHTPTGYRIDLDTIHDSASLLDWIFHLQARYIDIASLIEAFETILSPMNNYCPSGVSKRCSGKKLVAGYIRSQQR